MESIMRYISKISRCASLHRNREFAALDLNEHQHPYIIHLCRQPGMNQEELARKIYVNKSNVTRQLATLEKKGFVTKKPSPQDKRQMCIYPTEKAYQILPEVVTILKNWNKAILHDIPEDIQKILAENLQLIEKNAAKELDL